MLLASTSVGGIHFRSGFPSLDIGIGRGRGRAVFFGCTGNIIVITVIIAVIITASNTIIVGLLIDGRRCRLNYVTRRWRVVRGVAWVFLLISSGRWKYFGAHLR